MANWWNRSKSDSRGMTAYHISPERLGRFRPKSTLKGVKGIYFSPTYKSLIEDWTPYVLSHKYKKHPLYKNKEKLIQISDQLELELEKASLAKDKEKILNIKDQLSKINSQIRELAQKIMDRDSDALKPYKYLFLHKVFIPKEAYNASMEFWKNLSKDFTFNNMGFWAWGEQFFVPADFLDDIQIISIKKLDSDQLAQAHSDLKPRHEMRQFSDPDHPANWNWRENELV